MILALILGLFQEPTEEQLRQWARDLANEDPSVREEASQRLQDLGAAARGVLEEACVSRDPETSARAEQLLVMAGLPRPLNFMSLWLSLEQPPPAADPFEPPVLRLKIRNLGTEPRQVSFASDPSLELPWLSWGAEGIPATCVIAPAETPAEPVEVPAGDSVEVLARPQRWCPHVQIRSVQIVLRFPGGGQLASNALHGEVRPETPVDLSRYRGVPYEARNYRTYQRGATWFIDPEEINWAIANQESIVQNDVRLSAAEGGGVLVEFLRAGSILEARGIQQGDVITELNRRRIGDPAQLPDNLGWLASESPQQVYIRINRAGRAIVLVYRPAPR